MIAAVTGGASCRKSEYAEAIAVRLKKKPPLYLATMINSSAEDEMIVQRHRKLRKGKGFFAVEKPVRLYETELAGCDTVILEDVPNLVANEFFSYGRPVSAGEAYSEIIKGIDFLAGSVQNLVIVTGNVFEDGNIYDEFTETYLKTFGDVNIHIAAISDIFVEMVSGCPVFYKGGCPGEKGLIQAGGVCPAGKIL